MYTLVALFVILLFHNRRIGVQNESELNDARLADRLPCLVL